MTTTLRAPREAGAERRSRWAVVAVAELAAATVVVLLDLGIPTLVILALATASLGVRRQRPATLGFRRVPHGWRLAGQVLGLTALWTALQFGLVLPVLNHLTGDRQDLATFEDLRGNVGLMAALVAASWVLGSAEETVFRGYLQVRVLDVAGAGALGLGLAVLLSSVLFGLIHTEQGTIGIVVTTLDALFFSWLRWRRGTLWAPVLAHGFNNTIGIVTFFLVGPVYGLW
jgi:membrane protease YdiL (CAAX protease family)